MHGTNQYNNKAMWSRQEWQEKGRYMVWGGHHIYIYIYTYIGLYIYIYMYIHTKQVGNYIQGEYYIYIYIYAYININQIAQHDM